MAKGVEPTVKVLYSAVAKPPDHVRKALLLGEEEDVLELKRLYLVHDAPLCLIHYYLPMRFAEIALPLKDESLPQETSYSVFEKAGIKVGEAHNIIRAMAADQDVAKCLNICISSPVLALQRTTFSKKGLPLEFLLFYYRADEFEFSVRLYRPSGRSRHEEPRGQGYTDALRMSQEGHALTSQERPTADDGAAGKNHAAALPPQNHRGRKSNG